MTNDELIAAATEHAQKFERSADNPAELSKMPLVRLREAVVVYFESPRRDRYTQVALDKQTGDFLHAHYAPPGDWIGATKPQAINKELTVILKRFESPDEVRVMQKGKFELVHIGGMTIGRATYEPGSKWSEHVGPGVGATRCHVEHVGLVLSGTATAAFDDGRVVELHAGELFHIPPIPHDSWVIGDQPYVSLHFLGAEHYAAKK